MSVTTAELVQGIVAAAVLRAADELGWDEIARAVAVEVERPGDPAHGDYATNIAMKLTRILRKPPLEIAEAVRARIAVDDLVASVEVAKPGFVNLRLREAWLARQADVIVAAGEAFGRSDRLAGEKIQVEYISANPTGPMTVANARGGPLGDVLANVLAFHGATVTREYYINDTGTQVEVFGRTLAIRYRDEGVVGFDIAGAEAGHPPTRHLDAFEYLQRENAHFTIHAGEGFGLPSIWQALQWCGADRLGHGVRIIDDIEVSEGTGIDGDEVSLGRLAAYVRDMRIPLEMCPTSNVMTGAAKSIAEHPIGLLRRLHFRVTINTDNRLMSGTSMTKEFVQLAEAFDYTLEDFRWFTVNAMKSAFIPFDERLALIDDVIKPGYAALTA